MQILRLIAAAIVLAVVITISASAQTRPTTPQPKAPPQITPPATVAVPATKMAFIDTTAFGEEKGGINRYVNAVKGLEREFQPRQTELSNIQARIKTIADELNNLNGNALVDPKTLTSRRDEGERLQRDLKYKKDQADADFSKRFQDVVGPISTDIGKAIDQFAAQRGISLVLDVSKLGPSVLTLNPAMDVTQEFIIEYNRAHP